MPTNNLSFSETSCLPILPVPSLLPATHYLCPVPNPSLRFLARLGSVLLHPVFVPALLMAYLAAWSPNVFFGYPENIRWWWLLTVSYITITFPLLTAFLLWRLKFIGSLQMHELKERYAPLIASMLFYFWVFWLFHKQFDAPALLQTLLLGVFLNTVFVFMCSIFFKISLHSSAWGFVVAFALLCVTLGAQASLPLLGLALLLGALAGSARLYLQAHLPAQVWFGYVVGAISLPLAWLGVQWLQS